MKKRFKLKKEDEGWYLIGLRQLYFSMCFFVLGFMSLFYLVLRSFK